jgi:hypothetical protein
MAFLVIHRRTPACVTSVGGEVLFFNREDPLHPGPIPGSAVPALQEK